MKTPFAFPSSLLCILLLFFTAITFAEDRPLPEPQREGGKPVFEAIRDRHSDREILDTPLDEQTLSDLLWVAYGFNRENMRVIPTALNRQELDVYAVLKDGVYLYDAKENRLRLIAADDHRAKAGKQEYVATAPLNLIYVADRTKETDTGAYISVGCAVQNVYLACVSKGLACRVRTSIDKDVLHELFALRPEQEALAGQTIAHAQNPKVSPFTEPASGRGPHRVSEAEEDLVREALKKYQAANVYWLSWYPEDLPKFGYTFHMRGHADEVLSYEDIKSATNWYAEFKRKGISYIGVSRLLVIDIDALQCKRVVEDKAADTLEFDFVLKHDWMNAAGNGISGTWLGWFNGGIGEGTAILDMKTMTLREIRTANYDERYSDYFEIRPGRYVPRRIVIDKHNGDRSKSGQDNNLFFDFRFKVYAPCLWLFDRSVETDENGKEKTEYPVWIDNVTVDDKPAVDARTP